MRTFSLLSIALSLAFVTVAVGCDDSVAIPAGCDAFVQPSGDDQTTVTEAMVALTAGQTLCFSAGTFRMTDPVEVPRLDNLTIRGAGMTETTLDFSGQQVGGNGVQAMNVNNVVFEDFAIRDAAGNGLQVSASAGVTIRRVSVGWTGGAQTTNGKYAIYPVSSSNVLVEDSEAFGASDAGFYMGQTTNCIMRRNTARENVAAYEVENSTNCDVYENTATNNTGGILVFELPGLPMQGSGTTVHNNTVTDNNLVNFAEMGTIVGFLPTGTGVMVLAANDVEVRDNTIRNHRGTGALVISWPTVMFATGNSMPPNDPNYDMYAETVNIHANTFENNGYMPGGAPGDALAVATASLVVTELEDILWDGVVDTGSMANQVLCTQMNGAMTSFRNMDVLNNFQMSTTDMMPHDCTFPARSPVTLGGN